MQSTVRKYVVDPIVFVVRFILGGIFLIVCLLALAQQAIENSEMQSCIRQATYKVHDHDVAVHYCALHQDRRSLQNVKVTRTLKFAFLIFVFILLW